MLLLIALLMGSAWSPIVHADRGSQFGLVYGLSVPDAQNTKPFRLTGFKGQAFLQPAISAGGYYYQSDSSGQQSLNNKFSYSLTGIETAYHIPTATGDTFMALRIGLTKLMATGGGEDLIFSPYHYGFATGYDYNVGTYLSIGFEGSYLHAQPGRTTATTGVEYNSESFNIVNFLISFQFHL